MVGWLISLLPNNKQEKLIYGIALVTLAAHAAAFVALAVGAVSGGALPMFNTGLKLYQSGGDYFALCLFFDLKSLVYGAVASIITFFVAVFSRFYLHREQGYKRFFNNLLFFFVGLNVILLAGNFETLFIGWEVIGITSFFLIAFYRDRYLPVKNALKVVSLYRLADIALLIGIWACHHVFSKSINFVELQALGAQSHEAIHEPIFRYLIPVLFLLVAWIKSAQVPFSSWLPRAMEGPTTSSAIFYGSLSVHMGLFLLLRTYPLWAHNGIMQGLIIFFGAVTVIVATATARVQSTVKTQIAYASIAQIGLMFIEVAMGWHTLALVHFAGNAFLRTFQLLVSPSVLHYLIHDQFYNFSPPNPIRSNTLWGKLQLTLYTLGIKEWNLDGFLYGYFWQPLKKTGILLRFIPLKAIFALCGVLLVVGLYGLFDPTVVPQFAQGSMPVIFGAMGLLMALKAFIERGSALSAWALVFLNQLFTALSIGYNEQFDVAQILLFLSGIVVAGLVGYWSLRRLQGAGESIGLHQFHGHAYEYPRLSIAFMLACLGLSGFPITPTFIGEDLLLGNIQENQFLLIVLTAFNLIVDGLVIFRIYARVFLGVHEKTYHETAHRSS